MIELESLDSLLSTWGYLAVFLFVLVESAGIPFPGETMLLSAAVYAGTGHMKIEWVIVAAAAGAILGDNLGYKFGSTGGYALARRYGRFLRIDESKLAAAEAFYRRHGDKTVFFGRFIAILRTWAAFLAGVNHMPWRRFLFFNAAGGIVWASIFGTLGFALAQSLPLLRTILGYWHIASIALLLCSAAVLAGLVLRQRRIRSSVKQSPPLDREEGT